jgi:hypothetical protein
MLISALNLALIAARRKALKGYSEEKTTLRGVFRIIGSGDEKCCSKQ